MCDRSLSRLGRLNVQLVEAERVDQRVVNGPGGATLTHAFGTDREELAALCVTSSPRASFAVSCARSALSMQEVLRLDASEARLQVSLSMEDHCITNVRDVEASSVSTAETLFLRAPCVDVSGSLGVSGSLDVKHEARFLGGHQSSVWRGAPGATIEASEFVVCDSSKSTPILSVTSSGLHVAGTARADALELGGLRLSTAGGSDLEASHGDDKLFHFDGRGLHVRRVIPDALVIPGVPSPERVPGEVFLDGTALSVYDGSRDIIFSESCWVRVDDELRFDASLVAPALVAKNVVSEQLVGNVSAASVRDVVCISGCDGSDASLNFNRGNLDVVAAGNPAMHFGPDGISSSVSFAPHALVLPTRAPVAENVGAAFFDADESALRIRGSSSSSSSSSSPWVTIAPSPWTRGAPDAVNFRGTVSMTNVSCAELSARTVVADSICVKVIDAVESIGSWMRSTMSEVVVDRPLRTRELSVEGNVTVGGRIEGATSVGNSRASEIVFDDEIDVVVEGSTVFTFSKDVVGCAATFHPDIFRVPTRPPPGEVDGAIFFDRDDDSLHVRKGSTWSVFGSSWEDVDGSLRTFKNVSVGSALAVGGHAVVSGSLDVREGLSTSSVTSTDAFEILVGGTSTMEITPGRVDVRGTLEAEDLLIPASGTDAPPSTCTETEGSTYFGASSKRFFTYCDGSWTWAPARVAFDEPRVPCRGDVVFDDSSSKLRIYDGSRWRVVS